MWLIVAHVPVPSSHSTLRSATFEKRGTTTDRLLTRAAAGVASHSTISPISPPSHTDPVSRCSQSSATEIPRGAVCAACPALPEQQDRAGAHERTSE